MSYNHGHNILILFDNLLNSIKYLNLLKLKNISKFSKLYRIIA